MTAVAKEKQIKFIKKIQYEKNKQTGQLK